MLLKKGLFLASLLSMAPAAFAATTGLSRLKIAA